MATNAESVQSQMQQNTNSILHEIPEQAWRPDWVNLSQRERKLSFLGGLGVLAVGMMFRRFNRNLMFLTGAEMLRRGLTGHSFIYNLFKRNLFQRPQSLRVERSMTVLKPKEEVFKSWQNVDRFPSFMNNLKQVRKLNDKKLHWVAKRKSGEKVEWDTEVTDMKENEMICWRTTAECPFQIRGYALFGEAPQNKGTEVKCILDYEVPREGMTGLGATYMSGKLDHQNKEWLRRFKQFMETGEVPTSKTRGPLDFAA